MKDKLGRSLTLEDENVGSISFFNSRACVFNGVCICVNRQTHIDFNLFAHRGWLAVGVFTLETEKLKHLKHF